MRDTIEMAREAGMTFLAHVEELRSPFSDGVWLEDLKDFEALVRADEREETNRRANASWTLMCEKMVAAEREACAQVCKDNADDHSEGDWDSACINCADLIRAREKT